MNYIVMRYSLRDNPFTSQNAFLLKTDTRVTRAPVAPKTTS